MSLFVESCIDSVEAIRYTNLRAVEFNFSPMPMAIDRNYIKDINKYIFQDLPKLNIKYKAGVLRAKSTNLSLLNIKVFRLKTEDQEIYAARSLMDEKAVERFDKILKSIDLDYLSNLSLDDFIKEISHIYASLDYIGLYDDGNSRTLRAFLSRIAYECSYKIDFGKIARSEKLRDALYIARCKDSNKIAFSDKDLNFHKEVILSMNKKLENRDSLHALFTKKKIILPLFAVDFKDEIQYVFNLTGDGAHLFPKNLKRSMHHLLKAHAKSKFYADQKESIELLLDLCNDIYNNADNSIEAYRDSAALLPKFNDYYEKGVFKITKDMILN